MSKKSANTNPASTRRAYQQPLLTRYGALRDLTQNGSTGGPEGNNASSCANSNDRGKKIC